MEIAHHAERSIDGAVYAYEGLIFWKGNHGDTTNKYMIWRNHGWTPGDGKTASN